MLRKLVIQPTLLYSELVYTHSISVAAALLSAWVTLSCCTMCFMNQRKCMQHRAKRYRAHLAAIHNSARPSHHLCACCAQTDHGHEPSFLDACVLRAVWRAHRVSRGKEAEDGDTTGYDAVMRAEHPGNAVVTSTYIADFAVDKTQHNLHNNLLHCDFRRR
jgi:hypothetical protein